MMIWANIIMCYIKGLKMKRNDIQNMFIDMVETIANGKTNILDFGDEDMKFFRGEIHIIKKIGDSEGVYASEIAVKMGVTRAVIHKIINKLEKRNLIYKQIDEKDRKKKKLYLTERGKVAYKYHEEYHKKNDSDFISYLESLSKNESEVIKEFLEKSMSVINNHF